MGNHNPSTSYSNLNTTSIASFQENDLKQSSTNLQNGSSSGVANTTNGNNNKVINSYAADYLNTVRENRSKYGNYVDNALAFDPHKEKKSVYNVVYETDEYNPWGKPGGGAPKLDQSTGQLATKIRGTLKWNLTGETEDDRIQKILSSSSRQRTNQNLLMYKKGASPPISPRAPADVHRQSTTYNYNYRDPYTAPNSSSYENLNGSSSNLNSLHSNQKLITADPLRPPADYLSQNYAIRSTSIPQLPPVNTSMTLPNLSTKSSNSYQLTSLEREAADRQNTRVLNKANSFTRPKAAIELNRISNKLYNDNQPTYDNPNNPYWFGRTGPLSKTTIGSLGGFTYDPFYQDARRHKLLDALENRTPRSNYDYSAQNYIVPSSPQRSGYSMSLN